MAGARHGGEEGSLDITEEESNDLLRDLFLETFRPVVYEEGDRALSEGEEHEELQRFRCTRRIPREERERAGASAAAAASSAQPVTRRRWDGGGRRSKGAVEEETNFVPLPSARSARGGPSSSSASAYTAVAAASSSSSRRVTEQPVDGRDVKNTRTLRRKPSTAFTWAKRRAVLHGPPRLAVDLRKFASEASGVLKELREVHADEPHKDQDMEAVIDVGVCVERTIFQQIQQGVEADLERLRPSLDAFKQMADSRTQARLKRKEERDRRAERMKTAAAAAAAAASASGGAAAGSGNTGGAAAGTAAGCAISAGACAGESQEGVSISGDGDSELEVGGRRKRGREEAGGGGPDGEVVGEKGKGEERIHAASSSSGVAAQPVEGRQEKKGRGDQNEEMMCEDKGGQDGQEVSPEELREKEREKEISALLAEVTAKVAAARSGKYEKRGTMLERALKKEETVEPVGLGKLPEPAYSERRIKEKLRAESQVSSWRLVDSCERSAQAGSRLKIPFVRQNLMEHTDPHEAARRIVLRESANRDRGRGTHTTKIDRDDIIVAFTFFHPQDGSRMRTVEVLGSQTLADLRDVFECPEDVNWGGHTRRQSGLFFLFGAFYADMRKEGAIDYSQDLVRALEAAGRGHMIKDKFCRHMHETKIADLPFLKLYQRGAYLHQGDCEHRVVVEAVRMPTATDCQIREGYPVTTYEALVRKRRCQICKTQAVAKICLDDVWVPFNPSYVCDLCYQLIHVDPSTGTWRQPTDWKVFPHDGSL
uniref:snRNA-activating protein complex subunit 3 n=1 Tax=Chromera velia CCMP2878 TaxID=1169474 RepID=A0A0G4HPQ1_9ALVE|eukprot:Cvel_7789.t1-p1 / transcript=Cvel_7789.t1 / gene=Cvel_7789 / organism=Chromera_velia_CCMP2878 / gene_product=snRNA-activating protein complex subunit 3, putative / transcript_product=snRNA-activating protein complex subunit 3, putative / location=Cvel_scaffold415:31874-38035(+) / protein_length=766 / sequence_SO=supercontig / SO=protein_coding / is_pseudo=false